MRWLPHNATSFSPIQHVSMLQDNKHWTTSCCPNGCKPCKALMMTLCEVKTYARLLANDQEAHSEAMRERRPGACGRGRCFESATSSSRRLSKLEGVGLSCEPKAARCIIHSAMHAQERQPDSPEKTRCQTSEGRREERISDVQTPKECAGFSIWWTSWGTKWNRIMCSVLAEQRLVQTLHTAVYRLSVDHDGRSMRRHPEAYAQCCSISEKSRLQAWKGQHASMQVFLALQSGVPSKLRHVASK